MIDEDNVVKYAQDHKIQFSTYKDLTLHQDIRKLIQEEVNLVNATLARVEQVKKFCILPKKLYELSDTGPRAASISFRAANKSRGLYPPTPGAS